MPRVSHFEPPADNLDATTRSIFAAGGKETVPKMGVPGVLQFDPDAK
jgi:hypothetical protein